jgi:hypothetical protein
MRHSIETKPIALVCLWSTSSFRFICGTEVSQDLFGTFL